MNVRHMDPSTSCPAETSLRSNLPADLPQPSSPEPGTSRTTERSRAWAHPLQIRILHLTILYSLIAFSMLIVPVFMPLTQAVGDPALTWQARARIAADLLTLHDHYWLWALGAGLILTLQCIHTLRIMNHITGPLTHLRQALPHIRDGNLSIETTGDRNDDHAAETELLNQAIAQLKAKLSACKQAQAALAIDYDQLKQSILTTHKPDFVRLTKRIDQDLAHLRSALDWFKTHKG